MRIGLLLVLLGVLLGGVARAEGPGTVAVRTANDKVSALLQRRAAKTDPALGLEITTALGDFLDIEDLGRRALVDHWSKLSRTDAATFSKLLRELVEARYVQELRAHLGYEVAFLGEATERDGSLRVRTQVNARRKSRLVKISIDYRLHGRDKSWRVHDIITDGAGLVENYRAQFNRIIAKKGFRGLVDTLKAKRATL